MSSTPPKAPLAGRIVGHALAILLLAVAVRLIWQVLSPMVYSLSGVLLMAVFGRAYLRRFLK